MIELTQNAVDHLKQLLTEKTPEQGYGLRLEVERGGCAGLQYAMKVDQARAGDEVATRDGVSLFIDSESLSYLDGSVIDYVDDLNDAGFKVQNPKAARSCGCGTSFEPAEGA
jgi:iron-sulfur cluster assembly protein